MTTDNQNQGADGAPQLDDQQRQMLDNLGGSSGQGGPLPPDGNLLVIDQSQAEVIALLVAVLTPTFVIIAPNWQITPAEVQQLAQAYAPVILKYFPDGLGDVGPELAAALVTMTVLGSRIGTPRRLVPVKQEGGDADTGKPA